MSYFNNDPQAALGIAKPNPGMMGQRHDLRMARDRLSFQTEKQNAERQSILSSMDFKNELENRSLDTFKNQDRFKNAMEDLGKARQFREWRNNGGGRGMGSSYASGGLVQHVQAKGFVPVKVSNGEFEFTPEQVANIGAAMLASQEQVPA